MNKKIWFITVFILSIVLKVNADNTCDKNELQRLKELANGVEINYTYEIKEEMNDGMLIKYPVFSLEANNLNEDLKVLIIENYYKDMYKEFKYNDTKKAVIKGFKEGEKIKITIKAYVPNKCSGKTLITKTIKTPYYNNYYNLDSCMKYPDFKYCTEFMDQIITNEEFSRELNKYIDSKEVKVEEKIENKRDWSILYIASGIIIFLLIITIISSIIAKKRRKNSL